MRHRTTLLVVGLILVLAGALVGPGLAQEDTETKQIGDSHELATDATINEFQKQGFVAGQIDGLDATLRVAENREEVAGSGFLQDVGTRWLQLEYREGITRTLQIQIPADYAEPYSRNNVESITSRHSVDLERINGDWLQMTVTLERPGTVTVPLALDGRLSYQFVSNVRDRWATIAEYSPLDTNTEWEYIDTERLANRSAVIVANSTDADSLLIERDARPDEPVTNWIPVPEDDTSEPVYWTEREDGTVAVVAVDNSPPAVRVAEDYSTGDTIRSWINSAREIPERLVDGIEVPDWVPVIG